MSKEITKENYNRKSLKFVRKKKKDLLWGQWMVPTKPWQSLADNKNSIFTNGNTTFYGTVFL